MVAEASNGSELLRILDDTIPDIVLMDISMPEMDGIEATARLAVQSPETQRDRPVNVRRGGILLQDGGCGRKRIHPERF